MSSGFLAAQKYSFIATGAVFIAIALLLRVLTLGQLGLIDPSEGRYAVAAKDMVDTDNWITPVTHINGETVSFLAKPPLSIWLSAFCIKYLGENEFAVRLPSFVAGLVTSFSVGVFGFFFFGVETVVLSVLILLSSLLFFILSGVCIVDPILTACTAVCMTCFALVAGDKLSKSWTRPLWYIFVIGLSLGVLTKGPLALILSGVPIVMWMFFTKRWSALRSLPFVSASILFLCIVCPWFIVAERENPGFLRYLFVNENFLRYLVRDYGDRYGTGHIHFYGYIWILLFAGFLPWAPLSFALITSNVRSLMSEKNTWVLYLFLCAIFPPIFFTFARQITITYIMPSLPAFALLTGVLVSRELCNPDNLWIKKYFNVNLYFSIVLLAFLCVLGIALSVHWLLSLVSLSLLFMLLGLVYKTEMATVRLVAEVSMLSTSALLAIATINCRPWLDANNSTKDLVSYIDKNYANNNESKTCDFLFKIPYSFYFYSNKNVIARKIATGTVPYASNNEAGSVVIVHKSDLRRVKSPSLRINDQIGGWVIVGNL